MRRSSMVVFTSVFAYQQESTGCPECEDSFCEDCYRQEQACHSPEEHRLYVYLRANVDRSHPDLATDGINCKACQTNTKQGPFYRTWLDETLEEPPHTKAHNFG